MRNKSPQIAKYAVCLDFRTRENEEMIKPQALISRVTNEFVRYPAF